MYVCIYNIKMDIHKYKHDPALPQYIATLKNELKFKAKALYTLTCIFNCLSSSPAMYTSNI